VGEFVGQSSEGLARDAGNGDAGAFAEIFRRYRSRLELWVALRLGPLLRGRVSVEDVAQETFFEAYRSRDRFEARGPGSYRRWILQIAENRIRDLHKYHFAKKRSPCLEKGNGLKEDSSPAPLDRLPGSEDSPSTGAARREEADRLRQAIEALPDAARDVLILRAIEDLSVTEAAERLGLAPSRVKVLYLRALRLLRATLGDGK
jgi:RNA polymerase sigma-70 factor (ECF subfamily)